jgi:hypothetical protein
MERHPDELRRAKYSDSRLWKWGLLPASASFPPSPRLAQRLAVWEFVVGYRSATVPGSHRIPCARIISSAQMQHATGREARTL